MPNRFEWHYSVRKRFGETLCYYFISLGPTFDKARAFDALKQLFAKEQIKAHAYFEVFGAVDVVVRAWLPGAKAGDFRETLSDFLASRGCNIVFSEQFQVSANPYHWAWLEAPAPRAGSNDQGLDQLSVAELNEAQQSNYSGLDRLKDTGLLKETQPVHGVRFFVAIPPPQERVGVILVNGLIEDIIAVLQNHNKIQEAVLYRGVGEHVTVLIDGVVSTPDYAEINAFNNAMNAKGLLRFGVKTTTYLTTVPNGGSMESAEVTPATSIIAPSDVRDVKFYLHAQESEELEHKSSLEVDVNRFLATGEVKSNPALLGEVLETIVAFLNSDGGELLIGAIEDVKFKGGVRQRLEEFPSEGEMRICGINWEYQFTKERNWDGYQRKLLDLCADRIGASCAPYLKVRKLDYADRDLCLVQVKRLPPGNFAYLGEGEFFARHGASTRQLKGRAQEEYQRRRR